MDTRLLGQRFLLGGLLLSWGLFLDPKRTLLQWEVLIHHVIFGLSTFIPVGFFGFFFFSLSPYVPMGFFGFFLFGLNAYIPLSFFGFFFFVFLYPSTYFPSEPRTSASELGERLANPRHVWPSPAAPPVLPLSHPFELGGRLGNTWRVRSLSVVHPAPGLPFLLCGLFALAVLLAHGRAHPGR